MKHLLSCLAAFIILVAQAYAQPLNVVLNVSPNPSPYISDWEKQPSTVTLIVTNTGTASRQVKVDVKITLGGTLRAQTRLPQSPIVTIRPGTSTYFAQDVLNSRAMEFFGDIKETVVRTGKLPAGTYQICVQLIDPVSSQVVSTPSPVCRTLFATSYQAPILIQPLNNAELKFNERPVLRWTSVMPQPPFPVTYRVTVFEVLKGQTPIQAFQGNQPIIDRQVTGQTQLLWLPEIEPPTPGRKYVWSVQALDQQAQPIGEPDGRATPFTFRGLEMVNYSNNGTGQVIKTGDTLYIGKFQLVLGTLTSDNTQNLSGSGSIYVPFMLMPVEVEFSALKVNMAIRRVMDGKAVSKLQVGIPSVQSQLGSTLDGVQGKALNFAKEKIASAVNSAAANVVGVPKQQAQKLPVGIQKGIGMNQVTIALVGMQFSPMTAEVNALTQLDFSNINPSARVALGVSGMSFFPAGFGDETGNGAVQLFLAQDYDVPSPSSFGIVFKKSAGANSGTALTWDKQGFKKLALDADLKLPVAWLKNAANGNPISSNFKTELTDLSKWIIGLTIPKAEIAAAPGFLIEAKDVMFDQSDVANPTGILFPQEYKGTKTNLWRGLHFKNATITMPSVFKSFSNNNQLTFAASNILIDNAGISAGLGTDLNINNLNLGGWGGTLKDIALTITNNSLTKGDLNGTVQLPIAKTSIPYKALMTKSSGAMVYQFQLTPPQNLDVPMWVASFSLYNTSAITITNAGGSFKISAALNGELSLKSKIDGVDGMNFEGIVFNGFTLGTDGVESVGTWAFASPNHGMGGLPVEIKKIDVFKTTENGKTGLALSFDLKCHVVQDVLSGFTAMTLKTEMNSGANEPQSFGFKKLEVKEISLQGALPGVTINGVSNFFKNDATYGNGFFGKVKGTFDLMEAEVEIVTQFGNKGGAKPYRYWFVDAKAPLGPTGINFPPPIPLAFYGFGGGVFKNMKMEGTGGTTFSQNTIGSTLSGRKLIPTGSGGGFNLSSDVGLSGQPATFNANVVVAADFDGNGLGTIALDGTGYVMTAISERKNPLNNNPAYGVLKLQYNANTETFNGNLKFTVNVPAPSGSILHSSSDLSLLFSPDEWYIFYGKPTVKNEYTILGLASAKGYFIVGGGKTFTGEANSIALPPEVASLGSLPPKQNIDGGKGLAFGASYTLNTGRQKFLIFYGELNAGAGFDLALLNQNITCANVGAMGINGWYAFGQAYAYLRGAIGLHVDLWVVEGDFTILEVGAAALLQAQLPNPTWLKGAVSGKYSILDGLVEGNCKFEFQVGEKCAVQTTNQFDKMDIIQDIKPDAGATDVSVFAAPAAAFNIAINKELEYKTLDVEKSTEENAIFITKKFRFTIKEAKLLKGADSVVNSTVIGDDKLSLSLLPANAFSSYTNYTFRVTVQGEEFINNQWNPVYRSDGKPATQTKEITFKSGKQPDDLNGFVDASNEKAFYPRFRQRYYLQDELKAGSLLLKTGGAECLQQPGNYKVRFVPVGKNTNHVEVPFIYDAGAKKLNFTMNKQLLNNTIYRLEFIREKSSGAAQTQVQAQTQNLNSPGASITRNRRFLKGTALNIKSGKILYTYHFRTSNYNTLAQKVADVSPFLPAATDADREFVLGAPEGNAKNAAEVTYAHLTKDLLVRATDRRQVYDAWDREFNNVRNSGGSSRKQNTSSNGKRLYSACPDYTPQEAFIYTAPCMDGLNISFYLASYGKSACMMGAQQPSITSAVSKTIPDQLAVHKDFAVFSTAEPFDKADEKMLIPGAGTKAEGYISGSAPLLTENEVNTGQSIAAYNYAAKTPKQSGDHPLKSVAENNIVYVDLFGKFDFDNHSTTLTHMPSGKKSEALRMTMGNFKRDAKECPDKKAAPKNPFAEIIEKKRDSHWNPNPMEKGKGMNFNLDDNISGGFDGQIAGKVGEKAWKGK